MNKIISDLAKKLNEMTLKPEFKGIEQSIINSLTPEKDIIRN